MNLRRTILIPLLVGFVAAAANGQMKKPKVPPGLDPGGTAIALITSGIDYTAPDIARRLARDGEGDLIGWDFVDGDNRPHAPSPNATAADWGGDGTALVRDIAASLQIRLIPIRVDPQQPSAMAQAFAFAAATPARILLVPISSALAAPPDNIRQFALRYPQMLMVTVAVDHAAPGLPATPAANVLVVALAPAPTADIEIAPDRLTGPHPAGAQPAPAALMAAFMNAIRICIDTASGSAPPRNRKFNRLLALLQVSAARPAMPSEQPDCRVRPDG